MEKSGQNTFYKNRFKKLRAFLTSVTVLCALALTGLLLVYGEHGYIELKRVQQEHEKLKREVLDKQERNHKLAQEIRQLETDPEAIEKVAREDLHLAKPGEVIIKLLPKQKKELPDKAEPGANKP
jgi:cell division protein FtsL